MYTNAYANATLTSKTEDVAFEPIVKKGVNHRPHIPATLLPGLALE